MASGMINKIINQNTSAAHLPGAGADLAETAVAIIEG